MNVRRAALTVWILFQLAVIVVYFEVRGVDLKYELAERGRKLHAAGEQRRLRRAELETARQPEAAARRALALEKKPLRRR
jgi:hypothetical protein